jgi:hypothetical protein
MKEQKENNSWTVKIEGQYRTTGKKLIKYNMEVVIPKVEEEDIQHYVMRRYVPYYINLWSAEGKEPYKDNSFVEIRDCKKLNWTPSYKDYDFLKKKVSELVALDIQDAATFYNIMEVPQPLEEGLLTQRKKLYFYYLTYIFKNVLVMDKFKLSELPDIVLDGKTNPNIKNQSIRRNVDDYDIKELRELAKEQSISYNAHTSKEELFARINK